MSIQLARTHWGWLTYYNLYSTYFYLTQNKQMENFNIKAYSEINLKLKHVFKYLMLEINFIKIVYRLI